MTRNPRISMRSAVYGSIFIIGLVTFWTVALALKVEAHDAKPTASQPLGWTYDYSCCSLKDCREVDDKAVKVDGQGYTIVATGEVILYSDTRIKRSRDEFYHWCSVAGEETSRTLCLYVPDRGL